ncbi:MAG: hypothetical protein ACI4DV_07385 [Lachnospiraceae bacterium]
MVKHKWILASTVVILLVAFGFGYSQRKTYTDISKDKAYLDTIYVAQIPEDYAITTTEMLAEELPLAPVIIKVVVLGEVEHLARASRQLVKVQNVYKGEDVKKEQEIYITCDRWSLSLYAEPHSIERGFVNIMEVGEEYLLFVDGQADGLGEEIPIFKLYGESVVAPVFSYRTHTNKISSMGKESTYVLYNQVSDNEFFAATPEAMNAFLELKKIMLEKYL